MTIKTLLVAAAFAAIHTVTPATAAVKVSGIYAFMAWNFCSAHFNTTTANYRLATGGTAPAVQTVNPRSSGIASVLVGYITFPATPSNAGNATVRGTRVEGGTLRINNSAFSMKIEGEGFTAPFSLTERTFTLTPPGEGVQTYTMTYGDKNGDTARTIYLVRREDANCVMAISATKQAP